MQFRVESFNISNTPNLYINNANSGNQAVRQRRLWNDFTNRSELQPAPISVRPQISVLNAPKRQARRYCRACLFSQLGHFRRDYLGNRVTALQHLHHHNRRSSACSCAPAYAETPSAIAATRALADSFCLLSTTLCNRSSENSSPRSSSCSVTPSVNSVRRSPRSSETTVFENSACGRIPTMGPASSSSEKLPFVGVSTAAGYVLRLHIPGFGWLHADAHKRS